MSKKNNHKFIIHYVFETGYLYDVDIHTHGLNKYNQLELQLVLPFKEKEIADFINGLGNSVINGEDSFKEGCRTDLLLDNYQLWFIEVDNPYFEDDGVPTELRIIYPDEYNRMPWDNDCDEMYKGQIADIPPEKIREVLSKSI